MRRLNVEIKARTADSSGVRKTLEGLGARFVGTDHQTDTYFVAGHGRLKLREGNVETALIWYDRPDEEAPKASDVLLYHPADAGDLKEILTRLFDVDVVVKKRREIFFVDNVKFHIDEVPGLGHFVEIEAMDGDRGRTSSDLLCQCRRYMEILGIRDDDLVDVSYSDLLRPTGSRS